MADNQFPDMIQCEAPLKSPFFDKVTLTYSGSATCRACVGNGDTDPDNCHFTDGINSGSASLEIPSCTLEEFVENGGALPGTFFASTPGCCGSPCTFFDFPQNGSLTGTFSSSSSNSGGVHCVADPCSTSCEDCINLFVAVRCDQGPSLEETFYELFLGSGNPLDCAPCICTYNIGQVITDLTLDELIGGTFTVEASFPNDDCGDILPCDLTHGGSIGSGSSSLSITFS